MRHIDDRYQMRPGKKGEASEAREMATSRGALGRRKKGLSNSGILVCVALLLTKRLLIRA